MHVCVYTHTHEHTAVIYMKIYVYNCIFKGKCVCAYVCEYRYNALAYILFYPLSVRSGKLLRLKGCTCTAWNSAQSLSVQSSPQTPTRCAPGYPLPSSFSSTLCSLCNSGTRWWARSRRCIWLCLQQTHSSTGLEWETILALLSVHKDPHLFGPQHSLRVKNRQWVSAVTLKGNDDYTW